MKNKLLILCLFIVLVFQAKAQKPFLKVDSIRDWKIVFEDEFNGNSVDWKKWNDEYLPGLKHGSYSQPANAIVVDGELRLYIRRESVLGSTWTSASIFLKEAIKPYTYVECKIKPAQCTGVNNAFWLANRTEKTTTWKNREEIDMLETRLDTGKHAGQAHIGWHDWKSQPYLLDSKGKNDHVAQGKIIYHSYDKYEIWGIFFKENDYVIFHNGEAVWDGKSHHVYPNQYYTGIGKFNDWFDKEGKRAYGKWGQDDWNYQAGFNGDNLNLILTTYTWPEKWSPITDNATDKYMAVDYVRFYRPSTLLNTKPNEYFPEVKRALLFKNNYSLKKDQNYYFSAIIEKKTDSPIEIAFADSIGNAAFSVGIDSKNALFIHFGNRMSNTSTAYPSNSLKRNFIQNGKKYLIVIRVTAHKNNGIFDKDAISFSTFPLDAFPASEEPYFYPNIDSTGNTSITSGWDINAKNHSDISIHLAQVRSALPITDFKVGNNYKSVLPQLWIGPTAVLSGCKMIKPKSKSTVNVHLSGKSPWRIKYLVNNTEKEATGIVCNDFEIEETPSENTFIKLLEVIDADGKSGYIDGEASILILNSKNQFILPTFDTFIQPEQTEDFSGRLTLDIKGDSKFERQAYLSFDISQIPQNKKEILSFYVAKNVKKLPMKFSIQYVDVAINETLRFFNRPADERCFEISRIDIPSEEKANIGVDITKEVNYLKEIGAKTMNLRVVYLEGEKSNLVSFIQGNGQIGTNPTQIIIL